MDTLLSIILPGSNIQLREYDIKSYKPLVLKDVNK